MREDDNGDNQYRFCSEQVHGENTIVEGAETKGAHGRYRRLRSIDRIATGRSDRVNQLGHHSLTTAFLAFFFLTGFPWNGRSPPGAALRNGGLPLSRPAACESRDIRN